MKTIDKEIFNHDTDVDVTHKINTIELDNWVNHLTYIQKELDNLIGLCSRELNHKLKSDEILKRFEKKAVENENVLGALRRYMNSRSDILECDDMQCDMAYIHEHETYRRSYLYHLDKYRKLKDDFFDVVHDKLNLTD
ncbi:hypothetical protein [Psychroflexus tropicus]|uniref:hypothetical protein n=1 Tax=Psychroflexus tropicus TaxID=197345 RepID=UPI0003606835|nr:hypothetical protein [Psychroflexus tropicus]